MEPKTETRQWRSGFAHYGYGSALHGHLVKVRMFEGQCRWEQVSTIMSGRNRVFNPCTHYRSVECLDPEFPATLAGYVNYAVKVRVGNPTTGQLPIVDEYLSEPMVLSKAYVGEPTVLVEDDVLELKKLDAYSYLMQGTPKRDLIDYAQALLELKDSKSTIVQLLDFVKWGRSVLGKKLKVAKRLKLVTALTSVAELANAYLWYKFGVEPTAQDVSTFLADLRNGRLTVSSGKSNLEFDMSGRVITSHFICGGKRQDVLSEMTYGGSGSFSGEVSWEVSDPWYGFRPGDIVTGTSPFSGSVPDSALPKGRPVVATKYHGCYMAQFRQGVKSNPYKELQRRFQWAVGGFSTLWELTPFSFLVDWVVDVGNFIRRIEHRWLKLDISQEIGPPWFGLRETVDTYYPGVEVGTCRTKPVAAPADRYHSGRLNSEWSVRLRPISVRRMVRYSREIVKDAPYYVWPEFSRSIKAYQITTGMALLAQFAGSIARHPVR